MRKGKLKRILIILVVLIVVGSVACGGKGKDNSATEVPEEPETEAVVEDEAADAEATEAEPEAEAEEAAESSGSGDRPETDISPEFKETMDSYEEFFDEYVDFLNNFDENTSDPQMLMEYASLVSKEADMFQKMEDMDENEMTTAELAYYLEVTARIEAKLATVQ